MATIGLDKLYYAPITEDANGNETYGTPAVLAKAISAELSVELNEAILYADDGGTPVAVAFRARKSNGKYRYYWLYRVKFGIPATNLQTKGDSISFQTPTIEGTIMRRNKVDFNDNHPWKAEVTEGAEGVDDSVISTWYDAVYEPVGDLNLSPGHLPGNVSTT